MNVNEVMSTGVKSCHTQTSLEEVARMMWEGDCGAIPVVNDDNVPVGIITDRDISMAAMHRHQPLWDMKAVDMIQGQRLCCCHQEDPLEGCLTKMEQNGIRRIVVTNEDGTLSGIISMGDILAFTASRKKNGSIGVSSVLPMLRNVSGHHLTEGGTLTTQ